ncbi:MAG: type II toxin-antitoxin system VapC family toxin [Pyrinomonadaceae bacterium]
MSRYVLDSSAVIAYLNQEPGSDKVHPLIAEAEISAVNLAEVLTKAVEAGHSIKSAFATFSLLRIDVVDYDSHQARKAAELRPITRGLGLSLGDRSCLALAMLSNATVVTADRAWAALDVCPVHLIR